MPGRRSILVGATGKFPREARVRRRKEFVRIQGEGIRVHTDAFTIIARANELGRARLGCAVSRRVGNAVQRNRIRRMLKEVFRRSAAALPSIDLVVVAKPSAAKVARDGVESVSTQLAEGLSNAVESLARKRGGR